MCVFKVLHDDGGLDDDFAIVVQRRHYPVRVQRQVRRIELPALAQVDIAALERNALFEQDEPHLDGADRCGAVV